MDYLDDVLISKFEYEGKSNGMSYQVRVAPGGYRCGYVELCDEFAEDHMDTPAYFHGGTTYEKEHVRADGKKVLVLGFDCNHSGDLPSVKLAQPLYKDIARREVANAGPTDEHRTLEFCINECRKYISDLEIPF